MKVFITGGAGFI
ncbi:MAG: hypothetical protein KC443_02945, partial [Anaerolineales bacterium]|nr:hypothetical protein [Anaerolineales bacterium]